uniref:Uncharacterized protein n=1 Tax=Arundo donax TaxID=35708 RepID=A0A0A9CH58_ARUDO
MILTTSYIDSCSWPFTRLNLPASPSNVVLRTAARSVLPGVELDTLFVLTAAAIAHAVSYAQSRSTLGLCTS